MNWVNFSARILWYARFYANEIKYLRLSSPTEGHTRSTPPSELQSSPLLSYRQFGFYWNTWLFIGEFCQPMRSSDGSFRQTGKTLEIDRQSVTSIWFIKLVKVPSCPIFCLINSFVEKLETISFRYKRSFSNRSKQG